jgi:hypothetical protein
MQWHDRFEWNDRKAEANLRKHGVTLDQAAEVLMDDHADRFHLEEYDDEHSGDEDRFITTAPHPGNRDIVLVISWTERRDRSGYVTRIIGARRATPAERKRYDSEIA